MAVTRNKEGVPANKLLEAASQLSLPELENLINELHTLQAHLAEETSLLTTINNSGLSTERRRRHQELRKKLREERIAPTEHEELLELTSEVEAKRVQWLEALAQLARLRNMSLTELMDALSIKPPPVE